MDGLTLVTLAAAGSVAGVLTGLVPGLHVNTLAAVALATSAPGTTAVVVLVAVGVAHTFVSILPATYLGAPGEETALSVLPAHRLLHVGRASEAVHLSVHASLLGLLGAVVVLLPLRWLLGEPLRLLAVLDHAAPWLLGLALAVLAAMEAPRGPHHAVRALGVMALAAWLGLLAFDWPVRALVAVPASPLLPLLAGLFGVPGLVVALHERSTLPLQDPAPPWSRPVATRGRDVLPGLGVSAATAVLPGLTSAVATSLARIGRRTDDPRPVLATLSTVNTTHAVLALSMLWLVGRTRSGLAQAVDALHPTTPWTAGAVPPLFGAVLQTVLLAGVVGAVGTLWLERPLRSGLERLPAAAPSGMGLTLVVVLAAVLSGPHGLALLGLAAVVGTVPLVLGVRRVHLTAALIVPILVRVAS